MARSRFEIFALVLQTHNQPVGIMGEKFLTTQSECLLYQLQRQAI